MADESAEETFGVSVGDVLALAPNVSLGTDPDTDESTDLYRPADRVITVADVEKWITSVASRVDVRLARRALLPVESPYRSIVYRAAADAVANGSAAYLVGAAAPTRASINDPGAYDGVLWARFESALEGAATSLDAWLAPSGDGGGGAIVAADGMIGSNFPKPLFEDGIRF